MCNCKLFSFTTHYHVMVQRGTSSIIMRTRRKIYLRVTVRRVKSLKGVSKRYDPESIFQKAVPSGFKLSKAPSSIRE